MDDAAEQLAVARYLQLKSHDNILLRWVSKKPDNQRALGLLHEIGKARSAPGCLALAHYAGSRAAAARRRAGRGGRGGRRRRRRRQRHRRRHRRQHLDHTPLGDALCVRLLALGDRAWR